MDDGRRAFRPRLWMRKRRRAFRPRLWMERERRRVFRPRLWMLRRRWRAFRPCLPSSLLQKKRQGIPPLSVVEEEETEGIPPLSPVGATEEEVAEGPPSEIASLSVIPNQEEAPVIVGRAVRVKTRPAWWKDYVVETKVNYR